MRKGYIRIYDRGPENFRDKMFVSAHIPATLSRLPTNTATLSYRPHSAIEFTVTFELSEIIENSKTSKLIELSICENFANCEF